MNAIATERNIVGLALIVLHIQNDASRLVVLAGRRGVILLNEIADEDGDITLFGCGFTLAHGGESLQNNYN